MSENLIHRAADVHLKEQRKLVLVPREAPLGLIALRDLMACAEAGAVVLPAMPAFYTHPASIADMIDFIVAQICDQLGVEHQLAKRWGALATAVAVTPVPSTDGTRTPMPRAWLRGASSSAISGSPPRGRSGLTSMAGPISTVQCIGRWIVATSVRSSS